MSQRNPEKTKPVTTTIKRAWRALGRHALWAYRQVVKIWTKLHQLRRRISHALKPPALIATGSSASRRSPVRPRSRARTFGQGPPPDWALVPTGAITLIRQTEVTFRPATRTRGDVLLNDRQSSNVAWTKDKGVFGRCWAERAPVIVYLAEVLYSRGPRSVGERADFREGSEPLKFEVAGHQLEVTPLFGGVRQRITVDEQASSPASSRSGSSTAPAATATPNRRRSSSPGLGLLE